MTTVVDTFVQLPLYLQLRIANDWIMRGKENMARGLGIATHYNFMQWVAQEYDMTLDEALEPYDNPCTHDWYFINDDDMECVHCGEHQR